MRLSYGLLLAAAAAHVGPRGAVIALHLATVYAAAHVGYALALHRLRTGAERGAALPARHPCPDEVGHLMAVLALLMTAGCTGPMALLLHGKDLEGAVERVEVDLLMTVFYLSVMGCTMHVFFWMGHPQPQWMPEFLLQLITICPGVLIVPCDLLGVVAGWLVAAVLHWLLLLGLTCSLGYRAAVNLHPCPAAAADDDEIIH